MPGIFQIFILFIWIYIWLIVFFSLCKKRMNIIILDNVCRIFQTRFNSLLIILRTSNIAYFWFFFRFYLIILTILRIQPSSSLTTSTRRDHACNIVLIRSLTSWFSFNLMIAHVYMIKFIRWNCKNIPFLLFIRFYQLNFQTI